MKQWISLLLVLALTAGIMIGCGEAKQADGSETTGTMAPSSSSTQTTQTTQTTQSTAPMIQPLEQVLPKVEPVSYIKDFTDEERARVDAASKYFPWDSTCWSWITSYYRVYAKFGDVYVMDELKIALEELTHYETVNGLPFYYGTSKQICVLAGERIYPLADAFTQGILTEEQLLQVHINYFCNHDNHRYMKYCLGLYPEGMLSELYSLIAELYSVDREELNNWRHTGVQGVFGNVLVLYEPVSGEPSAETVEGMEFAYPDGTRLFVYYNGAAYSLQEAVDQGILRAEHLALVLDNHNYVLNGQ